MANARISYPHRRNRDGSSDSICLTCFATIAHGKAEVELAHFEEAHICDASFLAERGYFNMVELKRRAAAPAQARTSVAVTSLAPVTLL